MIRVEKLGDDVTRITMSSVVSRAVGYDVSAYVTRGVLIDGGFPGVRRELETLLDRLRPDGAIITHYHEDHAGNVGMLARRGLAVGLAAPTLAALRAGRRIGLYRQAVWGAIEPLAESPAPFAHDALALIATPGHSADHHAVWDAERGTLFSGDLFLGVKVRALHSGEDPRRTVASLRSAAALGPARMLDAHRGPVDNPVAMLRAKADWIEETVAAIERRIADGWRDRAIARAVLGREQADYFVSNGGLGRINFVRSLRATMER